MRLTTLPESSRAGDLHFRFLGPDRQVSIDNAARGVGTSVGMGLSRGPGAASLLIGRKMPSGGSLLDHPQGKRWHLLPSIPVLDHLRQLYRLHVAVRFCMPNSRQSPCIPLLAPEGGFISQQTVKQKER